MIIIDDKEYDPAEMTAEQQHLVAQSPTAKTKLKLQQWTCKLPRSQKVSLPTL